MKNQTGAKFLANERKKLIVKDPVCTQHITRESKLKRLPSGAVRRIRNA